MRILAIHGVGHADAKTDWQPQWRSAKWTAPEAQQNVVREAFCQWKMLGIGLDGQTAVMVW